jgi:predicted lipoprotein with Yx(FWY)xxD motif
MQRCSISALSGYSAWSMKLLQVLGDHLPRLVLHPGGDEGGEVPLGLAVEEQVLLDQMHGLAGRHALCRELLVWRVLGQEPRRHPVGAHSFAALWHRRESIDSRLILGWDGERVRAHARGEEIQMSRFLVIATVAAGLLIAGCGDDDDSETAADTAAATEAGAPPATEPAAPVSGGTGTTIKTADSQFGDVLFDGEDQAIYYFDNESGAESECYGACAEAWPPVLTEGAPGAGAGAQARLLGTTERDDGTTQITYDGHPLYYYAHEGPNQVTCHDVSEFGGLWLAVQPNGERMS